MHTLPLKDLSCAPILAVMTWADWGQSHTPAVGVSGSWGQSRKNGTRDQWGQSR